MRLFGIILFISLIPLGLWMYLMPILEYDVVAGIIFMVVGAIGAILIAIMPVTGTELRHRPRRRRRPF